MVALLIVAVALGLNNFGAAIAIGVSGVDRRTEIKVATVFGLCDVVMPATGMLIGTGLAGPLGSAARWAGAGILFVTAIWGLIEALRGDDDAPKVWHGWRLLVSGAALSLDDLAVGLALGTVRFNIVLAVTLFGAMSFIMSIIGLKLGGKLGTATGEHGEVVGAIVLIGISGAMAVGWLLPGRPSPTCTDLELYRPRSFFCASRVCAPPCILLARQTSGMYGPIYRLDTSERYRTEISWRPPSVTSSLPPAVWAS
jgi:putative Mn2+ efflux pump MntP